MTMRRANFFLDLLLLGLVLALVVVAISWYPLLPERFVIHLNGTGKPDGWATRHPLAWSLLPGVGLVLAALIRGVARWVEDAGARSPANFNMPDQPRFIALDIDARRTALAPTALFLRYTATLIVLLFMYIIEGVGRLSTQQAASWSSWPVFIFVALILGGLPWLFGRTRRAIAAGHSAQYRGT